MIDFSDYVERVDGRPLPKHLRFIAQKLQDVAEGRTKRLMISLPPGHGTTFIASQHFPAWYLSRWPERKFFGAMETREQIHWVRGRVRKAVESELHHNAFPNPAFNANNVSWGTCAPERDFDVTVLDFPSECVVLAGGAHRLESNLDSGDKWVRVLLPAVAEENDQLGREEGEALWPELYPIEFLEGIGLSPMMAD